MAYLTSANVTNVYPTAYRNEELDPFADNTTEYNVTKLVSRIGNGTYVVSYDQSTGLVLSINGYIFTITSDGLDAIADAIPSHNNVYFYIKLGGNGGNAELIPADATDSQTVADLDYLSGENYIFRGLGYGTASDIADRSDIIAMETLTWIADESEEGGHYEPITKSYTILHTGQILDLGTNLNKNLREELTTQNVSTETLSASGNASLQGNVNIDGTLTAEGATQINDILGVTGVTSITNTTESSAANSGALVVSGGVGIAKKLNVTGDTTLAGGVKTTAGSLTINGGGTGFIVKGGSAEKTLTITGNTTISSDTTISADTTINAATTVKKPLTVGAESTYIGSVEIKGKKNLSIIGNSTEDQTLTFNGTSSFQAGDYSSDDTTEGSEFIQVGGKSFNVVTRDDAQTITSTKTFDSENGKIILNNQTASQAVRLNANKELVSQALTTPPAGSGTSAISYVDAITQDAFGQIGYTKSQIKTATNSSLGLIKGSTADSGSTKGIRVGADGAMSVNVGVTSVQVQATAPVQSSANTASTTTLNTTISLADGYGDTKNPYASKTKNCVLAAPNNTNGTPSFRALVAADIPSLDTSKITTGTFGSARIAAGAITAAKIADGAVTAAKLANSNMTLGNTIVGFGYTYTDLSGFDSLVTKNIYIGSDNSTSYKIVSGGNCYMSNYYVSSDARLKENIKEFNCEKSILDLPVVEFDFKESGKHTIGCLAQDLQKICPELVYENENGYLSIEESKLVYLLLNEVKELKKEIEELKKGN